MHRNYKLYVGFTQVKGQQSIGRTVIAHSQKEARKKLLKKARNPKARIVNFYEDMYSQRGARWNKQGKRIN